MNETILNHREADSEQRSALGVCPAEPEPGCRDDSLLWSALRDQFELPDDRIQMALMLVAPHPAVVRESIDRFRLRLDRDPVEYVKTHREALDWEVAQSAAEYLGARPEEVALTGSTTLGLSLLYSGMRVGPGDDIVTTTHDHYSSDSSLELAVRRSGANLRRIPLYQEAARVSVDEVLGNLRRAILPTTRVVASTFVHSGNGVKMPIGDMSALIKDVNLHRDEAARIYFFVDAVHAFGVEDFSVDDLGCDVLVAGTHKWLFGPRGTGIMWAHPDAWRMVDAIVPPFNVAFDMWMGIHPERVLTFFEKMSPGGFHAFDHRWAVREAFRLHLRIGKKKIQDQTHHLSTLLKQELSKIPHVRLQTPLSSALSSGVNCFEIDGLGPRDVVKKLQEENIIASIAPYRTIVARLAPCVINTEQEIDRCVEVLARMRP